MPGAVFEVEGGAELRRTLRKAGDDLADLRAAHARAAAIVVPVGRTLAPILTGRLAGTVRGSGTKTAAIVRAGYASVPYANVQEWGWPRHHIAATHFLSLAATSTESQWVAGYQDEVEGILAKVKGA